MLARPRTVPEGTAPRERFSRRINGIALTGDNTLVAATTNQVTEMPFIASWTPEAHHLFPELYKRAVKALLMSSRVHADGPLAGQPRHPTGCSEGFFSLPEQLLTSIIARSAFPLASWMWAEAPGAAPSSSSS